MLPIWQVLIIQLAPLVAQFVWAHSISNVGELLSDSRYGVTSCLTFGADYFAIRYRIFKSLHATRSEPGRETGSLGAKMNKPGPALNYAANHEVSIVAAT